VDLVSEYSGELKGLLFREDVEGEDVAEVSDHEGEMGFVSIYYLYNIF